MSAVPQAMAVSAPAARPIALHPAWNVGVHMIAWWACVLAAREGHGLLGASAMAAFVASHLALGGARDAGIIALAAALGVMVDGALVRTGALAFPSMGASGSGPPIWMVALWAGFGAQLPHAFRWATCSVGRAGLFGLAAGPLAYAGGASLGVMAIPEPRLAGLASIGLGWAAALAVLAWAGSARPRVGAPGEPLLGPR